MPDEKNKEQQQDTVGEVGSSIAGGFDENKDDQSQLTNKDLKGKKIDADEDKPSDKPADQ